MQLHHLIYESQATRPFTEADLTALLQKSRTYNAARGLTGVLLYAPDGRFMQVLEGSMQAVYDLYFQRIARDPRHHSPTLLAAGPLQRARFADWRMGFRPASAEALAELAGYFSTADATFLLPVLPELPSSLLDKLLDYVQYAAVNPVLEEAAR